MKAFGLLNVSLILICPLAAQHMLVVKDDGKPAIVVAALGSKPTILKDGKKFQVDTNEFAFAKAKEYLPIHITVTGLWARTSYLTTSEGSGEMNKTFELNCNLESAYNLEDVFIVLLINSENAGKSIFLRGIDDLKARRIQNVHLAVPTNDNLGAGHFKLHVFVKGLEVFNSTLPFGEMESALNRIVRDRIKGIKEASAQPLLGPSPEYPKSLYKNRIEGQATLKFKISPNGSIAEPEVVEATQPEFGEAALRVIKQWRFLPKVEGGHPVETKAKMPFVFTPPEK